MSSWLVKQEPEAYSWDKFVSDHGTSWTGVRNFQARNNLRAMKKGDLVLYYHSVEGKEVVGIAKVEKEAYPDPTADEGDWVCVDLVPVKPLQTPVTLDQVKGDKSLQGIPLLKNSRLSVQPVSAAQFQRILKLGKTTPP